MLPSNDSFSWLCVEKRKLLPLRFPHFTIICLPLGGPLEVIHRQCPHGREGRRIPESHLMQSGSIRPRSRAVKSDSEVLRRGSTSARPLQRGDSERTPLHGDMRSNFCAVCLPLLLPLSLHRQIQEISLQIAFIGINAAPSVVELRCNG